MLRTRLPAVIPPVPPHLDNRERETIIAAWHEYLRCYMCDALLLIGAAAMGAVALVCPSCGRIVDERRVA